jgi:hypothetical protein
VCATAEISAADASRQLHEFGGGQGMLGSTSQLKKKKKAFMSGMQHVCRYVCMYVRMHHHQQLTTNNS